MSVDHFTLPRRSNPGNRGAEEISCSACTRHRYTKSDLEDHLRDIRSRLQSVSTQGPTGTKIDIAGLQRMEEEKDSTQKSLEICDQFLSLIDESRSSSFGDLEIAAKELDRRCFPANPSWSV